MTGFPQTDESVGVVPDGWDPSVAARFGYSFGVKWGRLLFIAGQVAINSQGEPVGLGEIETQTRCVFERLKAIVEAAGGSMVNIVRTTTYITDRDHRPITNELRREYFPGTPYPTNTLLVVAGLALPEYLVEIEAIAVGLP